MPPPVGVETFGRHLTQVESRHTPKTTFWHDQQGPALCLQAMGDTYKWMLYGDDDTLFFVDAVLDLLQPFDTDLPYAISDNIWFEANSALVSGPSVISIPHRSSSSSALHQQYLGWAIRESCFVSERRLAIREAVNRPISNNGSIGGTSNPDFAPRSFL